MTQISTGTPCKIASKNQEVHSSQRIYLKCLIEPDFIVFGAHSSSSQLVLLVQPSYLPLSVPFFHSLPPKSLSILSKNSLRFFSFFFCFFSKCPTLKKRIFLSQKKSHFPKLSPYLSVTNHLLFSSVPFQMYVFVIILFLYSTGSLSCQLPILGHCDSWAIRRIGLMTYTILGNYRSWEAILIAQ